MRQSAISYFADMFACPLLAGALAIFALTQITSLALIEWSLLVMIGAALWTLVEYVMHRLIYHRIPIFEKYHRVHHTNPQAYVGAPPMVGTSLVFLVSFMPLAALSPVLASAVSAGMLMGYTVYLIVHHACHFRAPTPGGYLCHIRIQHALHHHRDDGGNFGVTTSFWDRVFGTYLQRSSYRSAAT